MQNPVSEQIPIESQFDSTSLFATACMVQLGGITYSLQMCAIFFGGDSALAKFIAITVLVHENFEGCRSIT
jgi:hypothetical protein